MRISTLHALPRYNLRRYTRFRTSAFAFHYYILLFVVKFFSYIYTCIHCLFIRLMFICNCSFVIVRFNAMQRNYLYYLYIEFFYCIFLLLTDEAGVFISEKGCDVVRALILVYRLIGL